MKGYIRVMAYPGLALSQEMKMSQVLAPHLFQSLEILQMPLLDLQQMIKQELSENPTLEATLEQADEQIEIEQGTKDVERDEFDNELEKLAALGEEFDSYQDRGQISGGTDAEEKYQYMMDSLSEASSLHDQLLDQLALSGLDDYEKKIAEIVIGNIDDEGYLQLDVEDLLALPNFPVETLDKILDTIHDFEPAGVGARDLRECLLLQLKRMKREDSQEYQMIDQHLDLIGRHKYEDIARAMGLTSDRVKELAKAVAKLDPKPGRNFSEERIEYVTPEILVEKKDGEYVITQNKKPYPHLFISQKYLQMLKDPKTSKEVKTYIREKIAKSKQFIQSIDQRMDTIYRIAVEIVRIQRDYFDYGVSKLRPLNMKTVAELLEVHETTISRATAGKFMQTPRGLLSMKYFFKPGIMTASGEAISNESVKAALGDIVRAEDKKKPYSDAKIVTLLEEKGMKIARRTVAKYRDQLRILPSHLRKQH
ncbi:RNA polymerase sigma-54 factor [Pontiella sulfatireligans]|uniref:RNA polymerase sigma-54 factor n=2 Tax=Pontiella sulfatireligans TaxID=2750658 RepID=A0A6C2ULQ6_9BACT|nr:RNA polymerase sigma-54 factor [Pontiella sulfatireligans]